MAYSIEDAKNLIDIARKAIISSFDSKDPSDKRLQLRYHMKQGVFVTLKKHDELRGCIGFILPYYPLYDAVVHCSNAAAFEDSRFDPLEKPEMKDISIEISILTVPAEITFKDKDELFKRIKIGRDGIIIRKGNNSGLLLPQVFVEYDANPKTALEMTCEKAGLPSGSWEKPGCKIEVFSAQVFKELSPSGKVIEETIG